MKKSLSTIFAFICFLLLILCVYADGLTEVSQSTVYGKVLRLHVLADSDKSEDVRLKLEVRDALLKVTGDLFYDCKNVSDALETALRNRSLLKETADKALEENGSQKRVKIIIGKEKYPKKTYGSLVFPKGEYLSLRVIIGSGKGKNWWCVLFPPLCNAGIEEDSSKLLISYGLNEEEVKMLEKEQNEKAFEIFGCKVKFKILEYFD